MSAQVVRPHNHLSNRAKVRSVIERKPVFKNVLENPFQVKWPAVPVNVQNLFLARLIATLENIPSRTHPSPATVQKRVISPVLQVNVVTIDDHAMVSDAQSPDEAPADYDPGASQHLIIGINQVTRVLECQLRSSRRHVILCPSSHSSHQPEVLLESSTLAIVFVCCADVDPPALVDHIPHLVAGYNSVKNVPQAIKLVPLPKGSESTISQTLGLRRAAVIGIHRASPLAATFLDILDSVPVVSAPWLCPADAKSAQLVPTHIKQLRTTAPKDMKAAKEQRLRARTTAKKESLGSSRSVRRKPRMTLTTEAVNTS
ncbi:hypothetical protein BS17DRAFT_778644 [Gyrodon lividus]|nr:hypothetical protein BS17DRAFT_778644 [Gyrodon lividus]